MDWWCLILSVSVFTHLPVNANSSPSSCGTGISSSSPTGPPPPAVPFIWPSSLRENTDFLFRETKRKVKMWSIWAVKKKATEEEWALPFICWGSFFGGFYANFGVPFSRWKHNHLVQELINASNQILPVPSFICYITEELRIKERKSILDHFKWQCLPKFI